MEVSVETTRSSEFKQIYAIGAIGGHSPYDFRIAFYNDSPKIQRDGNKNITVMERKIEMEIILSPWLPRSWPDGWKSISRTMRRNLGKSRGLVQGLARRVTRKNPENLPPFRATCDDP